MPALKHRLTLPNNLILAMKRLILDHFHIPAFKAKGVVFCVLYLIFD